MNDTNGLYRIAVVADTHVPDRRDDLHADLLCALNEIQPDLILHAGDITVPRVIIALESVAPVISVRGNRDFLFFPHIPLVKDIFVNGVHLVLVHGHTRLLGYIINKVRMSVWGYRLEWFLPWLMTAGGDADVIIFGHTHQMLNEYVDGKLLFNPGSVNVPPQKGGSLSFGILEVEADGKIKTEVRQLNTFL